MGTSCMSNKKVSSSRASRDYSQYPDDLNTYDSTKRNSLQKHKFQAMLYNIAIINYPKNIVSLIFSIDGIVQVDLPRKSKSKDSQDIKWVIKQKFNFLADQYELRIKFLVVCLTDEDGKSKEVLKINLFKIATGPYHNDFQIKGDTRLKFDFKVSQYVQLKINCVQTKAELNKKQYPGQSFHFTIRVLKEENEEPFESNPSYTQTSPYLKAEKIQKISSQYDECPSPIKIRNKAPLKAFQPKCSFTWSNTKGQMPNFKILVKSNQIENTVLHLVIWRIQNQVEADGTKNKGQENQNMFCEAFTHFTQILQKDSIEKRASSTNEFVEERVLSLEKQGLWSDGEKIGQLSLKMVVENNLFIKQMKACTRTQQGIIESTPLFKATPGPQTKQTKVAKFTQIQQMMTKIQNHNKQINQNGKLSYLALQKLKNQMILQFQKIQKFFQSDLENSFYVPTTQQQILKMIDDQHLLMSILSRVISYAEDDDTLTQVCWRVINSMVRRGQFELNNIGFNKNDQAEMKKQLTPFYRRKIKVALQFEELQYRLLLQSIRIGYIEGRQDPRQAVEMFRASAYFRVPCYRQIILRKVVRKQDSSVEWNTSITDEQIQAMPEAQTILSTQLDWQQNFYKPLLIESKSQALTKQMIENLQGSLWLQQLSKRGSTFFYFLYFLISKLSELGKRIKFIKWQYFPGYNKLVRAFLYEMKNIKIDRYPQSMVQTSINLLANEKLLNILVTLIFQKTNVHDHNGLMKGLDLISRYLNHFNKNKKMIPPSFNYVYFFKGIKVILEGEFAYAIVKVLSIIFMNFDNFNVEFKKSLSFYLLGRVFFKLFLNWSFTTRKAFYHVLILKIQRTNVFDPLSRKQFSNKHQLMAQISTRYQQSLKIIKHAYEVNKTESSNRFLKNQNKDLFKHLKKKIALNKRRSDSKNYVDTNVQNHGYKRQHNHEINNLFGDSPKKLESKYSLKELTRSTSTERSYSVLLDPNILKIATENYRKDLKEVQQKAEVRTRSGTAYVDFTQEQRDSAEIKYPKKLRQRRRSIYGMDEFQMKEMDRKQIRYLGTALKQFDDLDEAIRKYYMTYSELPVCELDVEVPIDEKQIKPSSADFEEWQASENSDDMS